MAAPSPPDAGTLRHIPVITTGLSLIVLSHSCPPYGWLFRVRPQRCAGFPSSGIPYFFEPGRKASALRRRRARGTGKDRQPLSLGLCPMFRTQGSPPLSRFDASNARIVVACRPVQLRLSLRGCSTATRHSPRQYPEFHSHPVSQRRQRRGGYRHARPCLRFKVPHF